MIWRVISDISLSQHGPESRLKPISSFCLLIPALNSHQLTVKLPTYGLCIPCLFRCPIRQGGMAKGKVGNNQVPQNRISSASTPPRTPFFPPTPKSHLLSSPPPAPSEHGAVRDHAFAAALRQATEPQLQSQLPPLNSGSPNTLQSSASVVRDFRCN